MVDRPEQVSGPVYVDTRRERVLLGQALGDHALIRVELGLDTAPQCCDLRVDRSGAADHLEHGADAQLYDARVAGVHAQLACRVGLLEDGEVPLLLADRKLVAIAPQA